MNGKPGLRTSEMFVGTLSGGGIFEIARNAITSDMSLGAGIGVAGAILSLALIAMTYIKYRTVNKNGGPKEASS
jgi:hypothetical protein